jgi:hypothetical protein
LFVFNNDFIRKPVLKFTPRVQDDYGSLAGASVGNALDEFDVEEPECG